MLYNEEKSKARREAFKQYKNYGGGKTVIYNDYNNLHIYFDNNGLLYGMHLFNSLTFKINNILAI